MTYSEALAYLDSLAQFGWKLDLARIERLCELSDHPERKFPSVLVGGSAGKGSTCALLASILRAAGVRTGTSPKPHLLTHRERAQVDGELISEATFAAIMGVIHPLAEQVAREEGSPTVFEVLTLLAFLQFSRSHVERAVVEVGLGGRFDATNVLLPDVSIISMIGLDHTDRLGETVEEIAFEKAGIIKPGRPLITGARGGALATIERVAAERGSPVWALEREIRLENTRLSSIGTTFDLRTPAGDFTQLHVALTGEHQARNAALAAAAALLLRDAHPALNEASLRAGLANAKFPGRLQVVRAHPLVLLDGAHSPDRADALAEALYALYLRERPGRRVVLVIGCSQGHAPEAVISRLAPLASEIVATQSAHPAAVPAEEIAAAVRSVHRPVELVVPVAAAVAEAQRRAGPDDIVLVTGSLFAVGEALATFTSVPGGNELGPALP